MFLWQRMVLIPNMLLKYACAKYLCINPIIKQQPYAHPLLLLRSKTFPSQTLCALFCPCVSNNKCSQYGHLSSRSLGGTLYHRPPITSKEPIALRITDSRAKRRPDVNKHKGILPSKRLNYCCGQCHLTCHVGWCEWSALVVLMYSGAFYDLLKDCGEGGMRSTTLLKLSRSKSSVKTVGWYGISECFSP